MPPVQRLGVVVKSLRRNTKLRSYKIWLRKSRGEALNLPSMIIKHRKRGKPCVVKKKISEAEIKQMISELSRPQVVSESKPDSDATPILATSEVVSQPEQTDLDITKPLEPQLNKKLHTKRMQWQLVIAVLLTLPLLLLTKLATADFATPLTTLPHQTTIILALSTAILCCGGVTFFKGAWLELRQHQPAKLTLIVLALLVLYGYSVDAVIENYLATSHFHPNFFWQLAMLVDVALLGHILELKLLHKALAPINVRSQAQPKLAHKIDATGAITDIPVSELVIDDEVVVRSGEVIPLDGAIIAGATTINEAMLTGESKPVSKTIDDTVLAGAVNGSQLIRVKVTHPETTSFLAQVERVIVQTQTKPSKTITQAKQFARRIFYLTLIVALGALVTWFILRGLNNAILVTTTVLVIAVPHALNLAVPVLRLRFSELAAHNGLLVRNIGAVENAGAIKYALMDKTGTLTEGNFKIRSLKSISSEYSDSDILAIMATLEQDSTHPLAQGIKNLAQVKKITPMQSSEIEIIAGAGITGVLNNQRFALVSSSYLEEHGIDFDHEYFNKLIDAGNSVSFLVTLDRVVGLVAQGDAVKPVAVKFIRALKQQGITPVMLTGDNPRTALKIAKNLEIDEVKAHLKPEDKADVVKAYQDHGLVMMIGDGINDQLALTQADLGVALGAGSNINLHAADVAVVKANPMDILKLLTLAKQVNSKVKQSMWLLGSYNIVALALAVGILMPFGIRMHLLVALVIAIIATIIITINATSIEIE